MQTLFTHVAKIGADYIVCDPTVPCPPTPIPPGPSVPPPGGPQEHVPDEEAFWWTDAEGNQHIGYRRELEPELRRNFAIVRTAPVAAAVGTAPVEAGSMTARVWVRLETDEDDE
jgi:hypothetical protein